MVNKSVSVTLALLVFPGILQAGTLRARDLGTLGGSYSFARDINEAGEIAGESTNAKGETHAFFWSGEALLERELLPGYKFSMANGLNNLGQSVGYMRISAKTGFATAVLWEKDGKAIELPNLPEASYSQASDVNDAGHVAGVSGTRAVLWKNQKPTPLKSLGGPYSIALGINSAGWVVGNGVTKEGEVHASLWRDGKVIDLGTLGGRFSTANSINDKNQIVGSSETADGRVHAFVWEAGEMKDLGPGMIRGLNGKGDFVGESPNVTSLSPAEDLNQSTVWVDGSKGIKLETLEGSKYSSAFGINGKGTIVGVTEFFRAETNKLSDSEPSGLFHATVWSD